MSLDHKLENPRLNKIVEDIIRNTKTKNQLIKRIISLDVSTAFNIGVIHQIKKELKKYD